MSDIEYDFYTNHQLSLPKSYYIKKGLSGLINTGNICYSNSILHCLSHTLKLTDYFLSNKIKSDIFECNLKNKKEYTSILHFIRLLSNIWSANELINPKFFNHYINNNLVKYNNTHQHDSYEYLLDLLNLLHTGLSYKVNVTISGDVQTDTDYLMKKSILYWKNEYENNYSEIISIFNGLTVNVIECNNNNCKYQSNVFFESFNSFNIDININGSSTLTDCIDNFFNITIINDWKCEKCNNHESRNNSDQDKLSSGCTKKLNIWSLPNYLIIQLKRFDNNGNKIHNFVDFPIDELDLTKYICPIKKDANNYIYSLYAVNYHGGNRHTGHYWSSVKSLDNIWYLFNDGNISTYHINTDLKSQLVTSDAYILFYHRKMIK